MWEECTFLVERSAMTSTFCYSFDTELQSDLVNVTSLYSDSTANWPPRVKIQFNWSVMTEGTAFSNTEHHLASFQPSSLNNHFEIPNADFQRSPTFSYWWRCSEARPNSLLSIKLQIDKYHFCAQATAANESQKTHNLQPTLTILQAS